jgi:LMBR1-like membrane protein
MADVFLIVSITVAFLILFVVAVYFLVYYQHPDDHDDAYFPKFVVIIGIMLAGATALLLPLDVANNDGFPGTLGVCLIVMLENKWDQCHEYRLYTARSNVCDPNRIAHIFTMQQ